MICSHRCKSSYRHFAYLYTSGINHVGFLSISSCSHLSNGFHSFSMDYGDQTIVNSNSSLNIAQGCSGIVTETPNSFLCKFCSFSNNRVSGSICICLSRSSGEITFTNIVNNNSPSDYGVLFVYGSFLATYCVFEMNQHILFWVHGYFEISHSFISHSGLISTSSSVVTDSNNTFTKAQTYQIQFFHSKFCNADNKISKVHVPFTFQRNIKEIMIEIRLISSFILFFPGTISH